MKFLVKLLPKVVGGGELSKHDWSRGHWAYNKKEYDDITETEREKKVDEITGTERKKMIHNEISKKETLR